MFAALWGTTGLAHPLSARGEKQVVERLLRYNAAVEKASTDWNAEDFTRELFPNASNGERAWH